MDPILALLLSFLWLFKSKAPILCSKHGSYDATVLPATGPVNTVLFYRVVQNIFMIIILTNWTHLTIKFSYNWDHLHTLFWALSLFINTTFLFFTVECVCPHKMYLVFLFIYTNNSLKWSFDIVYIFKFHNLRWTWILYFRNLWLSKHFISSINILD